MLELARSVRSFFPDSKSEIVMTGKDDPEEKNRTTISIARARRELGFEPAFDIHAGLAKTLGAKPKSFFEEKT